MNTRSSSAANLVSATAGGASYRHSGWGGTRVPFVAEAKDSAADGWRSDDDVLAAQILSSWDSPDVLLPPDERADPRPEPAHQHERAGVSKQPAWRSRCHSYLIAEDTEAFDVGCEGLDRRRGKHVADCRVV